MATSRARRTQVPPPRPLLNPRFVSDVWTLKRPSFCQTVAVLPRRGPGGRQLTAQEPQRPWGSARPFPASPPERVPLPGAESHVSACGRCSRASLSRGRRPGDEETRPFLRGLWVPGTLPSRPQHHAPPVQWSLRLRASHTLRQHVTHVDVHGPAVADRGGLAVARPTAHRASLSPGIGAVRTGPASSSPLARGTRPGALSCAPTLPSRCPGLCRVWRARRETRGTSRQAVHAAAPAGVKNSFSCLVCSSLVCKV